MFKKSTQKVLPQRLKRIYTNAELMEFHQEMQKYLKESVLSDGSKIKTYDEVEYLMDKGAMSDRTTVKIKYFGRDENGSGIYDTALYTELNDKIDQWKNWQGVQEWGEKERLSQLDEMAQKMKIDNNDDIYSTE